MRDPERVHALFESALGVPAGEPRERLLAESGEDPDIVAEVRSLLDAHGRTGGLLDAVVDDESSRSGRASAAAAEGSDGDDPLSDVLSKALADRYEILEELGRGGTARVFLARERKHDRHVVLKVLLPAVAALWGTERFQREVDLVARLSHPNIVPLIDSGVVEGLSYYAMPYVEGTSLGAHLAEAGPGDVPLPRALGILADVAAALEHAHETGVVHRDLKPDNILLAGSHAYLLDFGVARAHAASDTSTTLTRQGDFVGTPRYAAPEQGMAGSTLDHRADLYAWGVLAYEVLTGTLPPSRSHPGVEVAATLSRRTPEAPGWLVELVDRCLDPDPANRPESASELLETLAPHLDPVPGPMERRGRWPIWAWPAAALVALAVTWLAVPREGGGPGTLTLPVAVAPFQNQTGDPALDVLGRFAGDWLTQGLQEVERVSVIPWPASLDATSGTGDVDPVEALRRETGAGTVITGSIYELGGSLRFRAEIVDAASGVVITAPDPVAAPPDSSESAILQLRERINGTLALATDSRLAEIPGLVLHPPTFDAYGAFDRGLAHYLRQEYGEATAEFLDAWARDTTFATSLLYAATTALNSGEPARADSLLEGLATRRARLSALDRYRWSHLRARLDGDGQEELRSLREAWALAPGSRAGYNLAQTANDMNRPREALDVLESMDPDRGALRGWAQYWTQLAHAHHLLGDFQGEAAAAREMADRYPERRLALVLEVRAQAAAGRVDRVQELISRGFTLAPDTYWSVGAAMVVAAEELRAHGYDGWEPWLEGAIRWLSRRIEAVPQLNSHRYWLGSAYYDLRDWSAARETFMELRRRSPDHDTYRGMAALAAAQMGDAETGASELAAPFPYDPGEHAGYLARLSAVSGDADAAIDHLSQALRHRFGGFPWVHASGYDDFRSIAGDSRFQRLMAPAS